MKALIALLALFFSGHAMAQQASPPPPPAPSPFSQNAIPTGQPQNWILNSDYPGAARRARQQGTVGFRLDVGVDGHVTNCTLTASSGSQSLDAATCPLLRKRAIFKPALDHAGLPVPGYWVSRFRWTLPN